MSNSCDPINCSTPGLPVHHQLPSPPKPMSIESVMPPNHLILCRPLLFLTSIFASIRVFSYESLICIRWPKYWSFSSYISPSNEHPGLISFRMDWLDLLAVQGTLKSLLQHHCSKASILQHSAFFIVQLSCLYMTTGKIIALTKWISVGWLLEEEVCREKKQRILNKGKSLTKNQKHEIDSQVYANTRYGNSI